MFRVVPLAALIGLLPLAPVTPTSPAHRLAPLRLEVAPTGNEARYKVREQLAGVDFPNDAVGVTQAVTGAIVLNADGSVDPALSKISIDLRPLKSDKQRRDGFVQRYLLETEQFPTAELAVTALRGAPTPLPTSGKLAFTLEGNFTVHGTTVPSRWTVEAVATPTGYTGTATTSFTFDALSLRKPRVAVVLSVEDTIALEYSFNLIRK